MIKGNIAGNCKIQSEMFPSNKEMNERWKPHTGHSIPNICLYGQGSR
jgi:hypothetical protein